MLGDKSFVCIVRVVSFVWGCKQLKLNGTVCALVSFAWLVWNRHDFQPISERVRWGAGPPPHLTLLIPTTAYCTI